MRSISRARCSARKRWAAPNPISSVSATWRSARPRSSAAWRGAPASAAAPVMSTAPAMPDIYIPGLSTRPGNFDTTGALFNPPADNGVLDAVTPPSLRGARLLAPYGHDGRIASLRDFVRNVIVGEFAGPEPSPAILDALVAYIQDIDFLPNPRLGPGGALAAGDQRRRAARRSAVPEAVPARSGAQLRRLPYAFGGVRRSPAARCRLAAGCSRRRPCSTPISTRPISTTGASTAMTQVVAHFDRTYDLGLAPQDRQDLVAYLTAVGDGIRPYERDGVAARSRRSTISPACLTTPSPPATARWWR